MPPVVERRPPSRRKAFSRNEGLKASSSQLDVWMKATRARRSGRSKAPPEQTDEGASSFVGKGELGPVGPLEPLQLIYGNGELHTPFWFADQDRDHHDFKATPDKHWYSKAFSWVKDKAVGAAHASTTTAMIDLASAVSETSAIFQTTCYAVDQWLTMSEKGSFASKKRYLEGHSRGCWRAAGCRGGGWM